MAPRVLPFVLFSMLGQTKRPPHANRIIFAKASSGSTRPASHYYKIWVTITLGSNTMSLVSLQRGIRGLNRESRGLKIDSWTL